jgi:cytoskeletal protein CcmA (bactofilin family)
MALWNQPPSANNDEKTTVAPPSTAQATAIPVAREGASRAQRESILGPGVTVEGRIEGNCDVRIGGTIKGEIRIDGDLVIDRGGRLTAKVSAANVTLGGELEGNVVASGQVKLLESSHMIGDLKASTLTVAAGSRMRGHVEFGWNSAEAAKFVNGASREQETKPAGTKPAATPPV